jgi:hypothetical protein
MKFASFLLVGVLLISCAGGCVQSGPEIVPIAGTVTYNGQPVPNVRIIFQPMPGRMSWGISDSNGRFTLEYDSDHKGAKVGTHTVYVVDESAITDPTAILAGVKPQKRAPETAQALAKYAPDKSTLTVEVKKADRGFQLKLD